MEPAIVPQLKANLTSRSDSPRKSIMKAINMGRK
jgi:hypothetical protein